MKHVVLLNAEYVQSICLARSFKKQGWRVTLMCTHRCSSGYVSRYGDNRLICPDPIAEPKRFKDALCALMDKERIDLIIPMIDDSAEFLSRNKKEFESHYGLKCAVADWDKFEYARNKQSLMSLCAQHNVPHPYTVKLPEMLKECHEQTLKKFPYPAMIKPDVSAGARGIVRVNSYDELIEKYIDIYRQHGSCTLQQYVDQPAYYYNVMIYRDHTGKMVADTVIKIRRYFPLQGGTSCYSETVRMPELVAQCERILDILDWKGFADFDVLEDRKTGELKIIEINPRVPSSLQGSAAAGVDFGHIIASDLFGGDYPLYKYKEGQQVRWFGLDIMWFIFSPERFRFRPSWFRFFSKNVSYHDGSLTNPLPFIAGCMAGLVKYADPKVRKEKLK